MAAGRSGVVRQQLQTLFSVGASGTLSDGQLLDRFRSTRGEAGERAFGVLVERHGRMVLRVCRAVLGEEHDAEDAFQATFLVLAQRAGSLRAGDSLAPWLYGVARRVASAAGKAAARRRRHETASAAFALPRAAGAASDSGVEQSIHDEIGRLPERLRVPIVLCLLEGLSHEQAAKHLGWPLGTVKSRLASGRERLRTRLVCRGLAPAAALLAAADTIAPAAVNVPATLAQSTMLGAIRLISGKPAAGPAVAALTEGALRMMFLTRLKIAAVAFAVLGVAAGAGFGLALQAGGDAEAKGQAPAAEKEKGTDSSPPREAFTQRPSAAWERFRDEQELLMAQLKRKQSELERAKAQIALTETVVATHDRLNKRRPGMVSPEEVRKAEADLQIATAQAEIVKAEIHELELRLDQMRRIQNQPVRLEEYLTRMDQSGANASLERRLQEVERKLDQLIESLKPRPKPPGP
jgi:RNA polymerase sigma factor (sigma-70 family)